MTHHQIMSQLDSDGSRSSPMEITRTAFVLIMLVVSIENNRGMVMDSVGRAGSKVGQAESCYSLLRSVARFNLWLLVSHDLVSADWLHTMAHLMLLFIKRRCIMCENSHVCEWTLQLSFTLILKKCFWYEKQQSIFFSLSTIDIHQMQVGRFKSLRMVLSWVYCGVTRQSLFRTK